MNRILIILTLFLSATLTGQVNRWHLSDQGEAIIWPVIPGETHMDHLEMSGLQISAIVHYGVENGSWQQRVQLVFPMLRTVPNDTHASLIHEVSTSSLPAIQQEGHDLQWAVQSFSFNGILSSTMVSREGLLLHRESFPSTTRPAYFDQLTLKNTTDQTVEVTLPAITLRDTTAAEQGLDGAYMLETTTTRSGKTLLHSGEQVVFAIVYAGRKMADPPHYFASVYEREKRNELIRQTNDDLHLNTPDPVLNQFFAFAKLRAVESIYNTRGGLMHGPGGGRYYAAIWANDQAEYANPFFPFLGNAEGIESAMNSFRHFARYMNDEYRPIPSSIIAEGTDYWNGAGDRGDMAMIAYGAARFALAYGNAQTARELWPLITWCLEYCRRQINSQGVVASDCDELENRFPAGKANLNTSCLYYDALLSVEMLGRDLEVDPVQIDRYHQDAQSMRKSIQEYFAATVQGYETYRYYDGNDVLRAWICTPLTVGIMDRAEGTIDALFSPDLWTDDGLATEAGKPTFWDRATLYALRGVLAAGETSRAMPFLAHYARRRLLGEHVPYAVEAWPEGNQRHLSAESALVCRVITEGLWGIRTAGLHAFTCMPQLPEGWEKMELQNVHLIGKVFDLEVQRKSGRIHFQVLENGQVILDQIVEKGESIQVSA
ncbi:MAG: hypothetical protein K9I85_12095 [Saprospiraceae bacterium]|nr:hypothetical protein [Saprospiraceae bacterium]